MIKFFLFTLLASFTTCFSVSAQNKISVVAHRGDWRNEPENSILAFQSAAAMGVDRVELDLKESKDGEIVIMNNKILGLYQNLIVCFQFKPTDY